VDKRDPKSKARLGTLKTARSIIPTPVFMPVGTRGTIRALSPEEAQEMDYRIILSNAYHLYLRPGSDLIEKLGGLHDFMDWPESILTDSGGFQIFSLAGLTRINDEGVLFQSHLDGSRHMFTPELSMEVQQALGSDIIMCLDDVRGHPVSWEEAKVAVERTHRWALRCKSAKKRVDPGLFGIVQGSMFLDLRRVSSNDLTSLDLDGYAIGGLSVGEPHEMMLEVIEATAPLLPWEKPRYLMGVGKPCDIVEAVVRGVDMFDCVLPTRNARNGALFTSFGSINIRNSRHRSDPGPVDPACSCPLCARYSRAYLRHLFLEKEIYGVRLATLHNLRYYGDLMRSIREAILEDRLDDFLYVFYKNMEAVDD
jgi:queuine tRNA-ribosyltransferase